MDVTWLSFLFSCIVGLALLYGPGYLFLRGIRFSRVLALCSAPLFGSFVYAALPLAYFGLGITCNEFTIGLPTILLAALTYGIGRRRSGPASETLCLSEKEPLTLRGHAIGFDVAGIALFVAVSTLVCLAVFLSALHTPQAFTARHDNITHLNLVRMFLDTGRWSSLHANTYLDSPISTRPIPGDGSFYPAAWSCLVALICLISRAELTVVVNAVVTLATCVVFPLGMYAFMRTLLPSRRRTILFGAIAITAFVNWPWNYIYTGPLYPNQMGISLQFAALAALITCFENNWPPRHRASFAVFCVVAFAALALMHPTTVFSSYVFMACYGAHLIASSFVGSRRVRLLVGYAMVIVGFWVFCYQLPMLQSVIGYVETEQTTLGNALEGLFSMQYEEAPLPIAPLFLCSMGAVSFFLQRRRRWFLVPVLFFALGYIATRMDLWLPKHWISGLWYSDKRRMDVNMLLYLMPVFALGLNTLYPHPTKQDDQPRLTIVRKALAVVLVISIYLPSVIVPFVGTVTLPYGQTRSLIEERYHTDIYSDQEVAFVNKARELIPKDALVINAPGDGSVWAYGINGLNVYYRNIFPDNLKSEADLIRTSLRDYASNESVRTAVRRIGSSYVLLLDKGVAHKDGAWLWQFDESLSEEWSGISSIDDATPGFTVVLAEGQEMRLYKIDESY